MKYFRISPRDPLVVLLALGLTAAAHGQSDSLLVKQATSLRAEPSADARSLAELAANTPLTRLPAHQGAYVQVRTANGETGWVRMFELKSTSQTDGAGGGFKGALRGLTSLINRSETPSKAGQATATAGIRGLEAEDIAHAQPNLSALSQAEALRLSAGDAQQFASTASLQARKVPDLPAPASPSTPSPLNNER